ncbi:MAG: hypothetical protein R6U44_12485 [Archaeoglobaceae archaeon]
MMSSGECHLCKQKFNKKDMVQHLRSCIERENEESGKRAFHIMVDGLYQPEYWIHIIMPDETKLNVLDEFLRDFWLECCGHASEFTILEESYGMDMDIILNDLLSPGMEFYHTYDFGSPTELRLKVISEIECSDEFGPIQILARNDTPSVLCGCGKEATWICFECSLDGDGWLCDECAEEHGCGEDMFLPVVNSPRVGVCGYEG